MMRVYGSLQNRLEENIKPPVPEVGMGATILMYSDRHAATVTRILSPSRIEIQRDKAVRKDNRGVCDSQEYVYYPNQWAAKEIVTLRQDGRWKLAGGKTVVRLGERDEYYDYSF